MNKMASIKVVFYFKYRSIRLFDLYFQKFETIGTVLQKIEVMILLELIMILHASFFIKFITVCKVCIYCLKGVSKGNT
jgi:hypothetical protein